MSLVFAASVVVAGTGYVYFTASRDPTAPASISPLPLEDVRVTQEDLTQRLDVAGTLEGTPLPIPMTSAGSGIVTWVPDLGEVVTRGQPLFRVNNIPVVLLYGSIPPWRSFSSGMSSGPDILELQDNLLSLGFGRRFGLIANGRYSHADAEAAAGFAKAEGLSGAPGTLAFGSVVFEPGPIVVTGYATSLGGSVSPGALVLQVEGSTLQVLSQIDASQVGEVHVGTVASVTLATGQVPVMARVSAIAAVPPAGSGSGSSSSIASGPAQGNGQSSYVTLRLETQPHAPPPQGSTVAVELQVVVLRDVFVVPVTALVALLGGGYALQVDDGRGHSHLMAVSVGLIDDVGDLAQVVSPHLRNGLEVEAPSS
jgi:peptidoglycan hydrolase-like protein with peptidoglycan-binding domain